MNKQILNETKKAYCDSTMEWEEAVKLRNLSYKASTPVSVNEAVAIMTKALGVIAPHENGYNDFCPAQLSLLPKGSMVTLAREGSVCVYVKIPKGERFTELDSRAMRADEFSVEPDGSIRLWWD